MRKTISPTPGLTLNLAGIAQELPLIGSIGIGIGGIGTLMVGTVFPISEMQASGMAVAMVGLAGVVITVVRQAQQR
jgi:hypothetical protein